MHIIVKGKSVYLIEAVNDSSKNGRKKFRPFLFL